MKKIPLGNSSEHALVSDIDYNYLSRYSWSRHSHGYPSARNKIKEGGNGKVVMMHTLLMGKKEKGLMVDHINMNRLDNRRENLRIVTRSQNFMNKVAQSRSKSGYKGVFQCNRTFKWRAEIWSNKKRFPLGAFKTKEEAAKAYNAAALNYHKEYARLNNI